MSLLRSQIQRVFVTTEMGENGQQYEVLPSDTQVDAILDIFKSHLPSKSPEVIDGQHMFSQEGFNLAIDAITNRIEDARIK
jgi:hypothetical protein